MRNISLDIARKNGRVHFFEDWALLWSKVQDDRHSYSGMIKEAGKTKFWPGVTKIFYHTTVQRGLAKAIRWQSRANIALPIRPQSALHHTISLCFLGSQVLAKVNGSLKPAINQELLLKALMIHNVPKGLGLADVAYEVKEAIDDISEYLSFREFIRDLYKSDVDRLLVEKIYLLQFCFGDISLWPKRAQNLMRESGRSYQQEIVWFKFIEHLDYLIYGVDQYVRFNTRALIAKVAVEQVPLINNLKQDHPDLGLVWTAEASAYFSQFI
jgi:hypothetical protein